MSIYQVTRQLLPCLGPVYELKDGEARRVWGLTPGGFAVVLGEVKLGTNHPQLILVSNMLWASLI